MDLFLNQKEEIIHTKASIIAKIKI